VTPHELAQTLSAVLAEHKAHDPVVLDVTALTSMTDFMIVAGGGTTRHLRALADHVLDAARRAGVTPLGTEGLDAGDWVLVDLTDVVVHLMTAQARAFYRLEDIWSVQARREGAAGAS
jgi:ribosome-associated protein